jgi:hypothetical protein
MNDPNEQAAEWLEQKAAWLRKEQQVQVKIDPDWTSVEIKPEALRILTDGLDQAAAYLRFLSERRLRDEDAA